MGKGAAVRWERGRSKPWHEAPIDHRSSWWHLWLTQHTHAQLTHETAPPVPPGRCCSSHARRRHGCRCCCVHVTHGWRAVCCSLCGCTGGWRGLLCSLLSRPRGTGDLGYALLWNCYGIITVFGSGSSCMRMNRNTARPSETQRCASLHPAVSLRSLHPASCCADPGDGGGEHGCFQFGGGQPAHPVQLRGYEAARYRSCV